MHGVSSDTLHIDSFHSFNIDTEDISADRQTEGHYFIERHRQKVTVFLFSLFFSAAPAGHLITPTVAQLVRECFS